MTLRERVALVIGQTNPSTNHVYIDGNDACLLIADRLIAAGLIFGAPDTTHGGAS